MLNKLSSSFFCALLFLIPLITFRGYYEGPKVFLVIGLGAVLIPVWLYRTIFLGKSFGISKQDGLFGLWILTLIVASLFGIHPVESVLGGSYRHQGVIFFISLWLIFKTIKILPPQKRELLYKLTAIGVILQAIIVFFQYSLGILYFDHPLGTIGESNALAGFLAIGTYYVFKFTDSSFYMLPVISLAIVQSRTGLIALLPNLYFLFRNLNKNFRMIFTILVVCLTFVFLWSVTNLKAKSFYEDRLLIWRTGIEQIASRPILGFGAESGEVVYEKAFLKNRVNLEGLTIDRSHNLLIDLVMWSGTAGLVSFTVFGIYAFLAIKDKYRRLAVLSFMVYSVFQPISVVHFLLLLTL